jgi:hypothetical protein
MHCEGDWVTGVWVGKTVARTIQTIEANVLQRCHHAIHGYLLVIHKQLHFVLEDLPQGEHLQTPKLSWPPH